MNAPALTIFAVLIALLVLDALTTWHVISRGATEANPLLRWLSARVGFWPATTLTKAAVAAVCWWAYTSSSRATAWLAVIALAYVCAVAWNLNIARRQRAQRVS